MSVMTDSPERTREGRLYRLGRFCARHPLPVLLLWLLLLLGAVAGNRAAGGTYLDDFQLPDAPAQQGADVLAAHEPKGGAQAGQIVFHSASGTVNDQAATSVINSSLSQVGALDHVLAVGAPVVSADHATSYATVNFDANPAGFGTGFIAQMDDALQPVREKAHLEVDYGGELGVAARPHAKDVVSEGIGVATAILVLLVGFGSVLAAFLPIVAAALGVVAGLGLLGLVAAATTFAAVTPTLAAMMGLGVGIDYALFLTTRHRQHVLDGRTPDQAAGRTVATSGHSVLIAATTVVIAMLGLYASGVSFIGKLGLAASITVAVAGLAAVTLVPALLGLAGRRIDRVKVRRQPVAESAGGGPGESGGDDFWHRYAHRIGRHPWRFLIGGVALLAVIATPALSMTLGHVDAGADPKGTTSRMAYDRIDAAFGAGANGPLTVVVDSSARPSAAAGLTSSLQSSLSSTSGVASVTPVRVTEDGDVLTATVIPDGGPQDQGTDELLGRLRDDVLPQALKGSAATGYVTGGTAFQLDFRNKIAARLPVIILVVIAAAVVLLLASFRSVLLALKAAVLNLLSIGAAWGVVVAVFQWGWGSSLLGVGEKVPVESYVPMMMFAIVFGLSMDYEVFLLSRVREAWLRTRDNRFSVGEGLAVTARVISCAALIMTSVFAAFLLNDQVVIKMLALGLAASVLIDATVIRLVVVPATMFLLGGANWWIPGWLDRILPHLEPETAGPVTESLAEVR